MLFVCVVLEHLQYFRKDGSVALNALDVFIGDVELCIPIDEVIVYQQTEKSYFPSENLMF